MKSPSGRDDRKDLERSDADIEGAHATPGSDPEGRSKKDVRTSGSEGGLGSTGQGMRLRETAHTKIAHPSRGDETGEGSWSGRDEQRGPQDTSAGERGTGESANQVRGNQTRDERR